MITNQQDEGNQITRRRFLKRVGQGTVASSVLSAVPLLADTPKQSNTRLVLAFSDLHIGRKKEILDSSIWLSRALEDLKENVGPISYALVLGDITQHGLGEDIQKYLDIRNKSSISQWFELAGNHEYYYGGIGNYTTLVRSTDPYMFIDGNIAWFFISDEKGSREGNITDSTFEWLKKNLDLHKDKVLIPEAHRLREDHRRTHPRSPGQAQRPPKRMSWLENTQ